MSVPTAPLDLSMQIPLIGLGTWRLVGHECTKTVQQAIELGYRHIDTAHVYDNHKAIGKALRHVQREGIFITTKIANEQIKDKAVEKSVEKACDLALKELGADYIDLYLLHWPDREKPLSAILYAMMQLIAKGKVRSIGVSNFTIGHLRDVLKEQIPLVANQVEFHPYLYQKKLLNFCRKHQITLISYRSLGKGSLLQDSLLQDIAMRHRKTSAQIILRWLIQQKIPTIPKASSAPHLRENLAIFDFALSEPEMVAIGALNRDQRFCSAEGWGDFDYE